MLRRVSTLVFCLVVASGCANHVRYADEMREREFRDVLSAVTRVEPREPVISQPFAELGVHVEQTVQIRRRETVVRLDEETPWRGQDELWEVPSGLVAVPFFIGVRASDKLFLGLIPDKWIESGMDWSFAALNPALNLESDARLEGREISRKSHDLEKELLHETVPLAGKTVLLSLEQGPAQRVTLDSAGHARVELLELVPGVPNTTPRVLHVEVPGEGVRATESLELPLARTTSARLVRAARAREAALLPGATPDSAAQALARLDSLGFPESALLVEHQLRDRQHANSSWLSRLDLALQDD